MVSTRKDPEHDKGYKLVPPEGGWGYLVAMGKIVTMVSIFGVMYGFALIFNDFLKEIGIGTSIVAVLGSCSSAAMSIAGLFSNTLAEKFTRRSTGVAAAIAYCWGTLFQVFAYSAWPLFVASVIHGAALGIIIPILFSTFNHYFVERRTFMTSATNIVIGLGQVASPLTVQYLLETFGFRGCLAIVTGINCHAIWGMLVMHPVEWHMKRVPIDQNSLNPETEKEHQLESLVKHDETEPQVEAADQQSRRVSKINSLKSSRINSRKSSVVDVLDWAGSLVLSQVDDEEQNSKIIKKKKSFGKYLDLSLLKDRHFAILILGVTVTLYSDHSFGSFQPLHLFELNYTKVEVSRIIAIGTAGDLISRCVLTVFTAFKTLPPRSYYCVALVLMIMVRYAFFYVEGFWAMAVITGVIGFVKTWISVPVGLIFAEYLPKERFATGYGLFMFLNGMFNLAIGPIIRFVKESTRSYIAVFHILNFLLIFNAVVWAVEFLWSRRKQKHIVEHKSKSDA